LPSECGGSIALGQEWLLLGQRIFLVDLPQLEPAAHSGCRHDRDIRDVVLGGVRQGIEVQLAARFSDVDAIELSECR
jgi:hypothetical protein